MPNCAALGNVPFSIHSYFILQHNRVVDAISKIPWYLLPLKNQRDIAHFLNRAQNGTVLRIGPLNRLDYETATNVRIKLRLVISCR